MQSCLRGLLQVAGGPYRTHRLALGDHLERLAIVVATRCTAAAREAIDGRHRRGDIDGGGRSAIYTGKLANLPLTGQQPERVVHARLETGAEIRRAGAGLEARPDGDGRHQ